MSCMCPPYSLNTHSRLRTWQPGNLGPPLACWPILVEASNDEEKHSLRPYVPSILRTFTLPYSGHLESCRVPQYYEDAVLIPARHFIIRRDAGMVYAAGPGSGETQRVSALLQVGRRRLSRNKCLVPYSVPVPVPYHNYGVSIAL